jgi:hypothetical protein
MAIPDFRRAFHDGEVFHTKFLGEFRIEVRDAGRLFVPSGRIVACDPLVFPENRPFRRRVPPGRYPVLLSIAHIPCSSGGVTTDQRIAVAMLMLGRKVPRRWQMAVATGQPLSDLKAGEFYGYPVDSGTGCFMDLMAAKLLQRNARADANYFEHIIAAMEEVSLPTRSWAEFPLSDRTGHNLVTFSSGFGDGVYASFWGFDADGQPACLVTDFSVLTRTQMFETVTERP